MVASFEPRSENQALVLDTIRRQPTVGIPANWVNIMDHGLIDHLAGLLPGSYRRGPEEAVARMYRNMGVCCVDQWIPRNPLTMGDHGYESGSDRAGKATTGAQSIVLDGMEIREPEDVVAHLERFSWPALRSAIEAFDVRATATMIVEREGSIQEELGDTMLKTGYGFVRFPVFRYGAYGYGPYFMAYALYPEVMERDFALQAACCRLQNQAAALAYREGCLAPLYRLDYDMADSRGMLVSMASLDRLWLPHFSHALEPMLATDVILVWHTDGNLMDLYPRLLEVGIQGFQGFQYECGMDYRKICAMKTRTGDAPFIMAGVSVTRTLPFGKPVDVRQELEFLVENGPETGLMLGFSSSLPPGAPWENVETYVEGIKYYRTHR